MVDNTRHRDRIARRYAHSSAPAARPWCLTPTSAQNDDATTSGSSAANAAVRSTAVSAAAQERHSERESERRQDCQHISVGWDLPLLRPDRVEPDDADLVDDKQGRALTEAGELVDHVVRIEHGVVGVGEQWERIVVVAREAGDALRVVGSDGYNLCACPLEAVDVCSQLREMPAAERSAEPSEENQHDGTRTSRMGKVKRGPVLIGEGEVGGCLAN
jgi:hypothetical protein